MPSALKAVLFADAVQYSRHMLEAEDATVAFMHCVFELFDELAPTHGGAVVKRIGDGVMVEFDSAVGAVSYGLSAQARLTALAADLPPARQISFRMGVHLGDVQRRDGDLYGHIVNVAARLEALADPGSFCISQAVYDQVAQHVPAFYRALGPRALKNIAQPVVAYQVRGVEPRQAAGGWPAWKTISVSVLDQLLLVSAEGVELTPKSLKARALLGYLALEQRPAVLRERLAGLLWSDQTREEAQHSLRSAVRQLRLAFERAGSDAFQAGSNQLSLTSAAIEVDLLAISESLARGLISPILVEGRLSPDNILAGLDHVDQVFQAWLRVMRHRWRDRLVDQLESSFERFAADPLSSKHAAMALLAIDPTHEQAACILMRVLAADDKAAAALRVYRALADVMERDFGIEPSAQAQEIVASIRAGRLGQVPSPPAPPGMPTGLEGRLPVIDVRPFGGAAATETMEGLLAGFRAELITCLIKFRDWVVIEDHGPGERSAAAVDYRLEAAATSPGESPILAMTLVETSAGRIIWSERFPIHVGELVGAWGGIARRIAAALDIYLSAERVSGSRGRHDLSLAAYDCWLRGENLLTHWEPEAENEAERLFHDVIHRMPDFAPAYASLASIYNVRHLIVVGFRRDIDLEAQALKLARKAVQLDPLETRAHVTLAWSCAMAGLFEQAEIHYELAIELNPNNPKTLISCAHGLAYAGQTDRASELQRTALELTSVVAPYQWGYIAGIRFLCGDYAGSVSAAARGAGSLVDVDAWKAAALAHLGHDAQARLAAAEFLAGAKLQWSSQAPRDDEIVHWVLSGFPIKDSAMRQSLIDGLARAGLPIVA